ncbi:MAG: 30S ribosomal protein S10 [Candidatus Shikimatogenerans sp. Tduv]|uniref:Small ribosomal subunit protein uS10 n=1 Tax=Candidatus Shikimatogenerans sp. Tduv TaxID=3158567 RepID=A0AAU7QRF6_9FLAO
MNNILKIKLKSYNPVILKHFINKIIDLTNKYTLKIIGPIYLPTKKKIFTVLRSPHVHKKSREQFIFSIHKRLIYIKQYNNIFINNLRKINFVYGVHINIKFDN